VVVGGRSGGIESAVIGRGGGDGGGKWHARVRVVCGHGRRRWKEEGRR